jgi:hypothetical protein
MTDLEAKPPFTLPEVRVRQKQHHTFGAAKGEYRGANAAECIQQRRNGQGRLRSRRPGLSRILARPFVVRDAKVIATQV